jgi:hypothetical protein
MFNINLILNESSTTKWSTTLQAIHKLNTLLNIKSISLYLSFALFNSPQYFPIEHKNLYSKKFVAGKKCKILRLKQRRNSQRSASLDGET